MSGSVWLLESDDRDPLGVYSSEERARFVADAIEATDPGLTRVVEMYLDPAVAELRAGMRMSRVLMHRDGTVEECGAWPGPLAYRLSGEVRVWWRSRVPRYRDAGDPDVLDAFVWARDFEHAVEIADGHRKRLIAAGEWLEVAP